MAIDRSSLPKITPDVQRSWRRTRQDRSAGGVAFRYVAPSVDHPPHTGDGLPTGQGTAATAADRLQIALIATHGGERWQLPKGSREVGETALETAIREVEEETGLFTESIQFLQTIDYWYWDTYQKEVPELVHKLVDFYLLRVVSGELNDSSYEVDDVQWFTPAAALATMTFAGEKIVVQQAVALLSAG